MQKREWLCYSLFSCVWKRAHRDCREHSFVLYLAIKYNLGGEQEAMRRMPAGHPAGKYEAGTQNRSDIARPWTQFVRGDRGYVGGGERYPVEL